MTSANKKTNRSYNYSYSYNFWRSHIIHWLTFIVIFGAFFAAAPVDTITSEQQLQQLPPDIQQQLQPEIQNAVEALQARSIFLGGALDKYKLIE